ncbi:MAG: efflux RND transporter periplasmic adaptor subunit [Gemmatimonadales bacterium]
MRLLRARWFQIVLVLAALSVAGAWAMGGRGDDASSPVVGRVGKGPFRVTITTSGELRALKAVNITVPPNAQQAEAYQMRIQTIVPEGTVVKEGDVVAELDRSTLATKMAEFSLALQKAEAVWEQAMLDSTLNLSKAREEIQTMDLGLEEKRLAKEQAVYEAPTVRRQAEIDYEKAQRALAQAKVDYKTKVEQAQAKMREVGTDRERQQNKLRLIQEVMAGFTVRAPTSGMVIYFKEWNGRKRTTGSQVSAWDQVVATLPDLSQMESVTFVNEIDVRKVSVGQPVAISLDSDPSKRLTGKVTAVANVGEQRPNTDAKVFEVKVVVDQPDTTLRPGMTTGNEIETFVSADVLFVPIEALSSEGGVPFVFRQDGGRITKQEVETGTMNEDQVVILRGVNEDDRILLSPPADRDRMEIKRLPGSTAAPPTSGDTTAPAIPLTDSTKATGKVAQPSRGPTPPSNAAARS